MTNHNFKDGDRVQLEIAKMVPHPDGLTDRLGEVLPVQVAVTFWPAVRVVGNAVRVELDGFAIK